VINVNAAEHDPDDRAVMVNVRAGLQPVRVAVSPNGSTVWVTARASSRVLAFSARRLLTGANKALIADVKVGTAPVGLAFFDGGAGLIVDDSDRFDARGAHPGLTIIDVKDALAGRDSVIAKVRSGRFPREVAVEADGQAALVTNFASDQLETVALGRRT
jgi:DNA-binding beta-propeller fold protein YncE